MTARMGPSRERLLELLERDDAETQLPITLAHHEPKAVVLREGDRWLIKKLVHDPQATVAWSGRLQPEIHTDISLGTLVGRGSGEAVQMRFTAPRGSDGWVMVQPYEEQAVTAAR